MVKVLDEIPFSGSYSAGSKALASKAYEKIVFIPEPSGSGDLYFIKPGGTLQKLDSSIRKIVEENLGVMDGSDLVYSGKKEALVLAIDPTTGASVEFGDFPKQTSRDLKNVVFLSRTQYTVNIWDKSAGKLLWKITYAEFIPSERHTDAAAPQTTQEPIVPLQSKRQIPYKLSANVRGSLFISENNEVYRTLYDFSSPIITAFLVHANNAGNRLSIAFSKQFKAAKSAPSDSYIGNYDGTFYAMSDENFPYIDKRIYPKKISYQDSKETECSPESPNFPQCLVGSHSLPLIDPPKPQELESKFYYPVFIATLFCILLATVVMYRYRTRVVPAPLIPSLPSTEMLIESVIDLPIAADIFMPVLDISSFDSVVEKVTEIFPNPADNEPSDRSIVSARSSILPTTKTDGLQSFEVSDTILGYGSHGTVVFKGTFQGRPVAIKRLLADFYDVADHEVKLLQQSDDHPNICRYFHKEYCEGFMYIALELCSATLFDVIQRKDSKEIHFIVKHLTVKNMLRQMMSGIDHLHSLNIVHRDIKPHNILILASGKNRSRGMQILTFCCYK